MSVAFARYKNALVLCLSQYQFIEESLRYCLIRCHATARFRLDGFLEYEIPLKAIEDAAVGRLIEWYKPYTKNQALIAELRKIKSARDHIAHMGLVLSLEEQMDEGFLEQKADELDTSHTEARQCFMRLLDEMRQTDEAVERAYALLRAEYEARHTAPPQPFVQN